MAGDTKDKVDSQQKAESRKELERWLNKSMRIRMTDGRTLVGIFLCTDCDCNIIMGACEEYLKPLESLPKEDPRILGLAMVPGKHVVSIDIDESLSSDEDSTSTTRNNSKDAQDNLADDDQSVGDNIQNPEEENVSS